MKYKPEHLEEELNNHIGEFMGWIIYKPILSEYENALLTKYINKITKSNFAVNLSQNGILDLFGNRLCKDLIDKQKK